MFRSYSTLSIASSRSSLASDLRDMEAPSPLPTEILKQDHQTQPSPSAPNQEGTVPIPEISVQSPKLVDSNVPHGEKEEQPINNGDVDNSPSTSVNEDGFVVVQSDDTLTSSIVASQSSESSALNTEQSHVNPESHSSVVGTTPRITQDAEEGVSLQEVARVDNRSPFPGVDAVVTGAHDGTLTKPRVDSISSRNSAQIEKRDRFSFSKGKNKTGDKSRVSRKRGKVDKPKKEHGKTDERSIDDTQSELSYQPDIDLSSKPQISKKARCKFFVLYNGNFYCQPVYISMQS